MEVESATFELDMHEMVTIVDSLYNSICDYNARIREDSHEIAVERAKDGLERASKLRSKIMAVMVPIFDRYVERCKVEYPEVWEIKEADKVI
jgi:hypothetical protein